MSKIGHAGPFGYAARPLVVGRMRLFARKRCRSPAHLLASLPGSFWLASRQSAQTRELGLRQSRGRGLDGAYGDIQGVTALLASFVRAPTGNLSTRLALSA